MSLIPGKFLFIDCFLQLLFLLCPVEQMHKIKACTKTDNCQDDSCYALGINAFSQAKAYQDHKANDKHTLD
jgi:hypothetical protein